MAAAYFLSILSAGSCVLPEYKSEAAKLVLTCISPMDIHIIIYADLLQ